MLSNALFLKCVKVLIVMSVAFFPMFVPNFVSAEEAEKNESDGKSSASTGGEPEQVDLSKLVFATVGDVTITVAQFKAAFQSGVRGKFYHGKVPQREMALFQREVGDNMVDKILVVKEAKRLGVSHDKEEVKKQITGYEQQYAGSEQWEEMRDRVLPNLTKKLEEDSLLDVFEKKVRDIATPSDAEARGFYEKNLDKFEEPEKVKVSAILLKVDPSSSRDVWEAAVEEGAGIVKRLKEGADFAELANIHSGDPSADSGGDMGYVHRGMLPQEVFVELDKLENGGLTDPIRTLLGIAIFRLDDRKTAKTVSFESAKDRARGLLKRDLAEKAWVNLKADLRKTADIKIDTSYYLPIPEEKNETEEEDSPEKG